MTHCGPSSEVSFALDHAVVGIDAASNLILNTPLANR